MKSIKRWRYYCDYCGKSDGSKYHMANHEASCTLNPDRECKMCVHFEDDYDSDLPAMIAIVKSSVDGFEDEWGNEVWKIKDGVDEIEVVKNLKAITNCPACILSAMRQSGAPAMLFGSFDYKAEKKSLWDCVNEDSRRG